MVVKVVPSAGYADVNIALKLLISDIDGTHSPFPLETCDVIRHTALRRMSARLRLVEQPHCQ
jgi:hypothetical protein